MNNSTKAANFALYDEGFYGNKLRTWKSVKELKKDKPSGGLIMRYVGKGGGAAYPRYGEPVYLHEVTELINQWVKLGADINKIVFNEEAPDRYLTIQGEVLQTINHLSLFWSAEKTRMRQAMKNGIQSEGLQASHLLKAHLSANSYTDLMELLELFPSHVIEFSSYSINLGSNPNRNTVIWEVRNY